MVASATPECRSCLCSGFFSGESLNETDKLFLDVDKKSRDLLVVDFKEKNGTPEGEFSIVLAKV